MTLEQNIVDLTAEVTKMLGKVDESRTEALREVSRLSKSLPYKYVVSTQLTVSTPEQEELGGIRTAPSVKEIQEKIVADRAAAGGNPSPSGLDQLTTPAPVTVYVDSLTDQIPVLIQVPNVEFVFSRKVVFILPEGDEAIAVEARDVTIRGGTYAYAVKEPANRSIYANSGLRTEVRGGRFINQGEENLEVDIKSLDNTFFDI